MEPRNLGQDLPILLNFLPSVVTTSDAGAGIGYTGIRVRGSDATRVNVTINGIPYNDSESQGTFGLIYQILVLQLKIFNYKGEWGLQQMVLLRLVQV